MSGAVFSRRLKAVVFWFSSGERTRRRYVKQLAVLQTKMLATRNDMRTIAVASEVHALRLTDQRQNYQRADQVFQAAEADLNSMVEALKTVRVAGRAGALGKNGLSS